MYRAVQVDLASGRTTGVEHLLQAETAPDAARALAERLGLAASAVELNAAGRSALAGGFAWTLVRRGAPPAEPPVPPSQRRAGPKHRRV